MVYIVPFLVAIGRLSLHVIGFVDAPVMYTASIGLYIIWIIIKLTSTLLSLALDGTEQFWSQFILWIGLLMKCVLVGSILFVLIPLMMGHLFELILMSPLRVPVDKLPVFYPSTVSGYRYS